MEAVTDDIDDGILEDSGVSGVELMDPDEDLDEPQGTYLVPDELEI